MVSIGISAYTILFEYTWLNKFSFIHNQIEF